MSLINIDAQGLTVREFEELLCDRCHNAPLTYFCPACDFRACSDCLPYSFIKIKKTLECKRCGHRDKKLDSFVGPDKF